MQMLHGPSFFSYLVESYIVTDKIHIINDVLRRKHACYMLFLVGLHDVLEYSSDENVHRIQSPNL
jgi:hypothetical protein